MTTASWIVLGAVVLLVGYVILIYNRLVKLRNRFRNAFAQIDVQLKRRYDLIPNLVETARRYLKHESETLQAVIEARNQAAGAARAAASDPGGAEAMKRLMGAEATLGSALGQFNLVVEDYPELKADQTMAQLSEELVSTENRVSFARQAFNDAVMVYNTRRESFPDIVFSGMFGFKPAELFEIEAPEERETVRVNF